MMIVWSLRQKAEVEDDLSNRSYAKTLQKTLEKKAIPKDHGVEKTGRKQEWDSALLSNVLRPLCKRGELELGRDELVKMLSHNGVDKINCSTVPYLDGYVHDSCWLSHHQGSDYKATG
jgi:hypothetical protein